MSKLFGVVGNGSMGRRRIRHLLKAGHRVVGWDIRADRRAEIEALFGIATAASEDDFLSLPLDGLFIDVPPADHEYFIFKAIAAGRPFMVEQPISHRLDNLERILEGVRAKALVSHVSCNHRFSRKVALIAELLGSGRLGKPLTGIAEIGEWLPDWHPYEPYTDYYPSWQRMGGGLDAVCDLDWLVMLFGKVRRATSLCSRKSDLAIDTYDVVQLLLDFEDGPQMMLHADMLQRPYRGGLLLVCGGGKIVEDFEAKALDVYIAADEVWERHSYLPLEPTAAHIAGKEWQGYVEAMYEADTHDFLGRLAAGDLSTASLESGIDNIRVVKPLIFPEHAG